MKKKLVALFINQSTGKTQREKFYVGIVSKKYGVVNPQSGFDF